MAVRVGVCLGGVVRAHDDILACTVFGAGGCLAYNLGLAVLVKVVDHELGIVCARTDILAQVDAPQLLAVEGVAVDEDVACLAVLRVIFRV